MKKGFLRDIEFEETNCHIASIASPSILVRWKIKKTSQNLKDLYLFIYRGESPSEMAQINSAPIPANTYPEYVDTTIKLKMLQKNYYYRIEGREIIDGVVIKTFSSKNFTWQGDLDIIGMYIIDEHRFAFEHVLGVPVFIYKKMNEGTRCPECWDSVLKRVTKSNCVSCFGTGFTRGYYNPLPAWMDLNPDPTMFQIADFGVKEPSQTDCLFIHYPILQANDIILELEPMRFWRVTNQRGSEKNRNTLLQVARFDEVNRSDIEQQLEVDQDLRFKMLAEFDARQKKPEF